MTQRETRAATKVAEEAAAAEAAIGQELAYWLKTPEDEIFSELLAAHTVHANDQAKRHAFIDNGADVLAVCHLDTVQRLTGATLHGYDSKTNAETVFATGLDDRLGAYAITHLLPFPVDLLYCDNEESSASTAQYFKAPEGKRYRYVLEFDRAGSDCVTYDIDSPEWLQLLRNQGAKIGRGSFTDLCYLDEDDHPTCMVNYGTGYERAHAVDSYANLDTLNAMVALAAKVDAAARAADAPAQWKCTNELRSGHGYGYGSYYGYTAPESFWGSHGSQQYDKRSYQVREALRRANSNPAAYFKNGETTTRFDNAFIRYCACCGSRMISGRHYAMTEWPFCADCEPDLDAVTRAATELEQQQKDILPF